MESSDLEMIEFLHPKCDGKIYNREDYIYDHSINEARKEEYISLFKDDAQSNMRYIFDNIIQHVSWKEFKSNLIAVARETVEILGARDFQFVIPKDKHKSNYFFTAIVNEEVFMPIGKKNSLVSDVIVNVDDMSYSGSQLLDTLKNNFTVKVSMTDKGIVNKLVLPYRRFFMNDNDIKVNQQSIMKPGEYTLLTNGKECYFITHNEIIKLPITTDNVLKIIDMSKTLEYVKSHFQQREVYINLDTLPNKNITLILCIPYISKNAYLKLQKFHSDYSTGTISSVNIIFPKSITIVPNVDKYFDIVDEDFFGTFFRYNIDWQNTTAVYFDHKLASPVSTVSVILGCGIVPRDISRSDKPESLGNLLNNCSKQYIINDEILQFKLRIYEEDDSTYDPETDESACINCPKPVYKYDNCDFKYLETSKELKDMGFNFSGYIGDGNILIE
jgi:hypothetical protein